MKNNKDFNLKHILNNINDEKTLDEKINKFQNACYTIVYDDLMNGIICEKENMFNAFLFFLKVNDPRMKNTLNMLNKYYVDYLNELIKNSYSDFLRFENYKMCEKMKNLNLI